MRYPGVAKAGHATAKITSNLDFAETILDVAGVPIPKEMQGRSLTPLLKGETPADWRQSFYYHYYEYPGPHSVARHYGVVTETHKLVKFYDLEQPYTELFDTKADPKELTDVSAKPEYANVKAELEKELARLRMELKVTEKDPPEAAIPSQKK
jgi:arylsulfatase A-like enzyme